MHLTHQEAQHLMLAAMGLHKRPPHAATKDDVLQVIREMGALQIDTISVVARSPYFVLWSRLGSYNPEWLDDLLAEGHLFEYWSHAACLLPIDDFGLYRRRMLGAREQFYTKHTKAWVQENQHLLDQMLRYIRENGEVRSLDFARPDGAKSSGWWDHKEEKRVLELLLSEGEVMIARRDKFQRVYDLRERVLPGWKDDHLPNHDEIDRAFAEKSVKALGITAATWVADYFRLPKRKMLEQVRVLAADGGLLTVEVEGWDEPAFVHPDNLPLLEAVAKDQLTPELTTLLSPFDPLTWDRDRALKMFNFDYRIECYTPEAKRRYGYFSLPILWRGALIGRLDAKAHRKERRFDVKVLHLEPGVTVTDAMLHDLAVMLRDCAAWHNTPQVQINRSDPPEVADLLKGQNVWQTL